MSLFYIFFWIIWLVGSRSSPAVQQSAIALPDTAEEQYAAVDSHTDARPIYNQIILEKQRYEWIYCRQQTARKSRRLIRCFRVLYLVITQE
jgi:hypothetical protein